LSAALDFALVRAADHIDVVINNAGRGSIGPIEAFSMTQIERLMSTNALGPIRVDRAVLPSMKFQLRPDPLAK
jgi:short-subunit dehydrogenase